MEKIMEIFLRIMITWKEKRLNTKSSNSDKYKTEYRIVDITKFKFQTKYA